MSDKPKESKQLSRDEILEIVKALQEAFNGAGRTIETGVLYHDGKEELLIDNRKPEDIN